MGTVAKTQGDLERALFVRGELRQADEAESFYRRVSDLLGTFLQVKNLSVLVGAGPSYPLGSPRIRSMSLDDVNEMVGRARDGSLVGDTATLVSSLIKAAGGKVDLERLLSTLTAAASVLTLAAGDTALTIGGVQASLDDIVNARRVLNRSLAQDCDLPIDERTEESFRGDPLRSHMTFFRRLLGARRVDLPRLRIFTTNYDLLIEKALDALGIAYFDGFSGGVSKVFRPESYEQDLFLPPVSEGRRMLRVPDVLYLYKLHGSINWRSRPLTGTAGNLIVQVGSPLEFQSDEYAIIYPTPQKEIDALGYPYSALFRALSEELNKPDAALLVVGFGFGDDHINRLILEALGNPAFQMMIVSPGVRSVSEGRPEGEEAIASFAALPDGRIRVVTGSEAGRFASLAERGMPDVPEPEAEDMTSETRRLMKSVLSGED
jgi:SIR2-like domain